MGKKNWKNKKLGGVNLHSRRFFQGVFIKNPRRFYKKSKAFLQNIQGVF
jgi:hypothetical protein